MDEHFFEFLVSGGDSLSDKAFRIYCVLRSEISNPASDLTRALRRRGVLASSLPASEIARRVGRSAIEVGGVLEDLARLGWLSIVPGEGSAILPVWQLGTKTDSGWIFMAPGPAVDTSEGCESIDDRVGWSGKHIDTPTASRGGLLAGSGKPKRVSARKKPVAATTRLLMDFGAWHLETFGVEEKACVPWRGSAFPKESYGMMSNVLTWVDDDDSRVLAVMEWLFTNWEKLGERKCLYSYSPTLSLKFFCSRAGFFFGAKWHNARTFPPAAAVPASGEPSFFDRDSSITDEVTSNEWFTYD